MNPILIDLPMPIRTPRHLIRNPLPGDGPAVNAAILDSLKELQPWMPWAEKAPTLEESEVNVRESYAQWILRQDLRLSVFDPTGKTQYGSVGLHRMNWEVPSFELGYWVRTPYSGRGYVTEAANAVVRYAFLQLKAKRVEARCDADNDKSRKVMERLGFDWEGRLRMNGLKAQPKAPRDTLVYSRLNLDGLPELEVTWG